jgi:hypothetical protein
VWLLSQATTITVVWAGWGGISPGPNVWIPQERSDSPPTIDPLRMFAAVRISQSIMVRSSWC